MIVNTIELSGLVGWGFGDRIGHVAGLNWARALSVRREGRNCSLVFSGIGDWSVGLGSVFGLEKTSTEDISWERKTAKAAGRGGKAPRQRREKC